MRCVSGKNVKVNPPPIYRGIFRDSSQLSYNLFKFSGELNSIKALRNESLDKNNFSMAITVCNIFRAMAFLEDFFFYKLPIRKVNSKIKIYLQKNHITNWIFSIRKTNLCILCTLELSYYIICIKRLKNDDMSLSIRLEYLLRHILQISSTFVIQKHFISRFTWIYWSFNIFTYIIIYFGFIQGFLFPEYLGLL